MINKIPAIRLGRPVDKRLTKEFNVLDATPVDRSLQAS